MAKVLAPVGNPLVNMSHRFTAFCSSGVPFSAFDMRRCAFARANSSLRKKRGLATFSPFDPTSTPTAVSQFESLLYFEILKQVLELL